MNDIIPITPPPVGSQLGDRVDVTFGDAGLLSNCEIVGIRHKKAGKGTIFLYFDLRVLLNVDDDGSRNYATLYNIPNGLIIPLYP